jgi:GH15 family glucan-1,4-alpha-glucosidase
MLKPRRLLAAVFALAALAVAPRDAHAEQRTWSRLTTGNGHGFQIFDADQNKITQFLEHPYRYLAPQPGAPPPTVPQGDGIGRRNLAFDFFFGVRGGGGAGWLNQPQSAAPPEYLDQTNIIHAPATAFGVNAESYFFAPFGLEHNVMIGLLHAPGATDGAALFNFHMGSGRPDPDANGESTTSPSAGVVVETGPGGGAMVYVALTPNDHADCQGPFGKIAGGLGDTAACNGNDIAVGFQGKLQNEWYGVAIGYTDDAAGGPALASDIQAWAKSRTPDAILADARAEWDAWRKPPPAGTALCSDDEKKLWRMSEATLRMGQVREPNIAGRKNHGMILASLPYGEWHSGWVRDAQYALVALARMGHTDEAKMALDFFLNAEPVGKYKSFLKPGTPDYRISVVRYFGTGEEEADYSGQNTPNVEIDGWGMVLWSARQYLEASNDTAWLNSATRSGSVYDVLNGGIAAPLEFNLEANGIAAADSGIWEVHDQNKRHFAYTTLAAARGFCDMAAIAKRAGNAADVTKFQGLATKVKTGFLGAFVDPQGALAGSIEGLSSGKYFDGAVAEAFDWNVLDDWQGATAKATLDVLGKLRVDSGGYKRNNDGLSSYDNNEWILVDLRIANALRRSGRGGEGDGVIATIVAKAAANFYLLPELYNAVPQDGQIGKYTGSIPMVGYGGGAFIMTMLDRSGLIEPNDCGDGKGKTLPKVDCTGVSTTPGTGGPGDADGGTGGSADGVPDASQIPFVDACLCRLGPDPRIPPFGLALFLALPVVLLVRRKVRP